MYWNSLHLQLHVYTIRARRQIVRNFSAFSDISTNFELPVTVRFLVTILCRRTDRQTDRQTYRRAQSTRESCTKSEQQQYRRKLDGPVVTWCIRTPSAGAETASLTRRGRTLARHDRFLDDRPGSDGHRHRAPDDNSFYDENWRRQQQQQQKPAPSRYQRAAAAVAAAASRDDLDDDDDAADTALV